MVANLLQQLTRANEGLRIVIHDKLYAIKVRTCHRPSFFGGEGEGNIIIRNAFYDNFFITKLIITIGTTFIKKKFTSYILFYVTLFYLVRYL